ncbi:acyl dehydratase [Breoghania corrubedonensis]|uniref:Acyl dehydratase n=1 Tax=Breoghania corrubedonensis TaxID=665038 RepID=A0A2T5UTZ9_9HYPH|nr:MaoC family dehydratase [Breoghania corrubedonensis]PTW54963.1 acyl dehydratase [Breoghania corrubedonensis]
MKFFEDIEIGVEEHLGAYTFTAEEIKAFAAKFDPQPFHMDEEAARQSSFGGLCASGWHTAAIWMKVMIAYRKRQMEETTENGDNGHRGPSPGFEDMKWLKPVYAGDTVSYTAKVVSKRPLATRAGWGLVSHDSAGVNQHGETVFSFRSHVLVGCRSAVAAG